MTFPPFIVFDAYGTLLRLDDFFGRLQRGFAERGIVPQPAALKLAMHREMNHYIENACRAVDEPSWLAVRRECAAILANTLRDEGFEAPLAPEAAHQVLTDAVVFDAFDEVAEVLGELEDRGIPMGVASNWDYNLAEVLRQQSLADYFHFALPSARIGCEKPAAQFFDHVRDRVLALHPGTRTIYYVGDHYEKDVVPSRQAGFEPLWLVRDGRDAASGETHESDCNVRRIASLTELPALFA